MAYNRRRAAPMPDPQIMMVPIPPRRLFVLRMLRNSAISAGVVGRGQRQPQLQRNTSSAGA
ncbi:MAG TPA: hypothetical protein VK544_11695 [Gemmatimonadaceae bacterium]|nr:hypothetical protein [Gemmatimonadaceae bacterium]